MAELWNIAIQDSENFHFTDLDTLTKIHDADGRFLDLLVDKNKNLAVFLVIGERQVAHCYFKII